MILLHFYSALIKSLIYLKVTEQLSQDNFLLDLILTLVTLSGS